MCKEKKYGGSLFTRGGGELGQSESVLNKKCSFFCTLKNRAFEEEGGRSAAKPTW